MPRPQGLTGLTSVTDVICSSARRASRCSIRLGRIDDARASASPTSTAWPRADGSDRALAQARMSAAIVEIAAGDGDGGPACTSTWCRARRRPDFPEQMTAWALSKRAQALLLLRTPR